MPSALRRQGYASTRWPGRLELLSVRGRDVLLDGAHNPAGAAALAQAIDDLLPWLTGGDAPPTRRPPLTVIMAVMADKDVSGIVSALAGAAATRNAHIVCTGLDVPRSMAASDLAAVWSNGREGRTIEAEPDLDRALDRMLTEAPGPIVVAGSLYLVGAVRGRLVDDPFLVDPEAAPARAIHR